MSSQGQIDGSPDVQAGPSTGVKGLVAGMGGALSTAEILGARVCFMEFEGWQEGLYLGWQ